jgi:KaiC/GvpD/RAD55 family RecA-like ATPase
MLFMPSVGSSCMVYGKPKSGKSTMSIDFAHHLTVNYGKVLYAAIEEGYGYTMKEKLQHAC